MPFSRRRAHILQVSLCAVSQSMLSFTFGGSTHSQRLLQYRSSASKLAARFAEMLVNAFETARWKTGYAPKNLCSSRCALLVVVQVDDVFCLCAPTSLGRKIGRLAIADRLRGGVHSTTGLNPKLRNAGLLHSTAKNPANWSPTE